MKWLKVVVWCGVCGLVGGIAGGLLTLVDWPLDPMGPFFKKPLGIAEGAGLGLVLGMAWISVVWSTSGSRLLVAYTSLLCGLAGVVLSVFFKPKPAYPIILHAIGLDFPKPSVHLHFQPIFLLLAIAILAGIAVGQGCVVLRYIKLGEMSSKHSPGAMGSIALGVVAWLVLLLRLVFLYHTMTRLP